VAGPTGPGSSGVTVTIAASPASIATGASTTLTVVASNATAVVISDNVDSNTYKVSASGGTQKVTPTATTIYTATATGASGNVTAQVTVTLSGPPPTVTISADPGQITAGGSSTLTVVAGNAAGVVISDNVDTNTYTLTATGGTQVVSPTATTIYTATATNAAGGTATANATVTVVTAGSVTAVNHVIFMMQENRTFDTYFGMLNPYRQKNSTAGQNWNVGDDGNTYNVDGIDDKLTTISNESDPPDNTPFPLFHTVSTCLDDMTSSWLESYGDVSRYNFTLSRDTNIPMDGFVHTAENYALSAGTGTTAGEGSFSDFVGKRAMAYYTDTELNYYYYMASQFALSDRWFSPVATKTVPNRIATLTGGTTQGLVFDPFADDKQTNTLTIPTIFEKLDNATPPVSWKIYYTLTEGSCDTGDGDCGSQTGIKLYPVTTFSDFGYSGKYLYGNPSHAACSGKTQSSTVVGDGSGSFCIDTTHIATMQQFFADAAAGTLPAFSYIEPGYGANDEHPGSGQSILKGQAWVATILGKLMNSPSWADSVFFLSYDEGGGPYDHVPPVPGHSNDKTSPSAGYPDIGSIAVNPDNAIGAAAVYWPCADNGTPSLHCDLSSSDPGAHPDDAPALQGFAAQLGFRLPNMVISPFSRRHYVSHKPMDHTAILKFVESRFIGPGANMTYRDAAQPDLLDFFDFTGAPWLTPPAAASIPVPPGEGGTCTPKAF